MKNNGILSNLRSNSETKYIIEKKYLLNTSIYSKKLCKSHTNIKFSLKKVVSDQSNDRLDICI